MSEQVEERWSAVFGALFSLLTFAVGIWLGTQL
jgi:hypothetical protein